MLSPQILRHFVASFCNPSAYVCSNFALKSSKVCYRKSSRKVEENVTRTIRNPYAYLSKKTVETSRKKSLLL